MDLEQLRTQKLFPSRKLGDALIVQPQGSLGGYGRTIISGDVNGILQAVKDHDIRVVVLNLGGWNYYGSEMIGMFFQLRRSIPEQVRVVISDPSNDMRKILETMNVHQVIPIYATQKEAVAHTAHVSIRDRLPSRRYLLPIVIVLALIAVGFLGVMFAGKEIRQWAARFGATPEVERYQRALEFSQDLRRMRDDEAATGEWAAFSQRVRAGLSRSEAQQGDFVGESDVNRLLSEAEQTLLMIVQSDPQSTEHDQKLFDLLSSARSVLDDQTGLDLEAPPSPRED